MKVVITGNYDMLSKQAYGVIKEVVKNDPHAVLGLATGSSPIGLYKNMIEGCKAGNISYKNIKSVNLDEYVGLGEESDQSYVYFMRKNLFLGIDINLKNTYLPNGKAKNLERECERYTKLLEEMKQDIQVLGIGANGHIGFNEPGTSFDSTTNIISLKAETRKDNARFFASPDEVPTLAITMGIKNIMNAKKILVVANGINKADAIKAMIEGEVTTACPASVLQRHPDVVVIVDTAAASKLNIKKA